MPKNRQKSIKALSLYPHFADLIRQGIKTVEIRTWQTQHRGPLLICATKTPPGPNAGQAVCLVDLTDIRPLKKSHLRQARIKKGPPNREAFAWRLKNPRAIKPFPVKGLQRLYSVTPPAKLQFQRDPLPQP